MRVAALQGEIVAYWEQGWEGRIEFAFQSSDAELTFLKNGDRLTIFSPEGVILWTGTIHLVPRRCWDRHQLTVSIWSDRKQKGVAYGQWMDWFWRQPPLSAQLIQA